MSFSFICVYSVYRLLHLIYFGFFCYQEYYPYFFGTISIMVNVKVFKNSY